MEKQVTATEKFLVNNLVIEKIFSLKEFSNHDTRIKFFELVKNSLKENGNEFINYLINVYAEDSLTKINYSKLEKDLKLIMCSGEYSSYNRNDILSFAIVTALIYGDKDNVIKIFEITGSLVDMQDVDNLMFKVVRDINEYYNKNINNQNGDNHLLTKFLVTIKENFKGTYEYMLHDENVKYYSSLILLYPFKLVNKSSSIYISKESSFLNLSDNSSVEIIHDFINVLFKQDVNNLYDFYYHEIGKIDNFTFNASKFIYCKISNIYKSMNTNISVESYFKVEFRSFLKIIFNKFSSKK